MKQYSFAKFTSTGARAGNYSISLSGSYTFGFNSGFYVKESIKSYKKVVLFWDKTNKAVGFQFTNDENAEGAFTIVHPKSQSTGSVTARSFIITNSLNRKEYYGRKTPHKVPTNEYGKLFVIDLKDKT